MQRLPPGFSGRPYRQTDGAVFSVVEGTGRALIESRGTMQRLDFEARDHFVLPSWHTARFETTEGCVLFSFSDRPVHQALGIHNEQRFT